MKTEPSVIIPEEKLITEAKIEVRKIDRRFTRKKLLKTSWIKVLYSALILLVLAALVLVNPKIFKRDRAASHIGPA
jgi:hypothetical protein